MFEWHIQSPWASAAMPPRAKPQAAGAKAKAAPAPPAPAQPAQALTKRLENNDIQTPNTLKLRFKKWPKVEAPPHLSLSSGVAQRDIACGHSSSCAVPTRASSDMHSDLAWLESTSFVSNSSSLVWRDAKMAARSVIAMKSTSTKSIQAHPAFDGIVGLFALTVAEGAGIAPYTGHEFAQVQGRGRGPLLSHL